MQVVHYIDILYPWVEHGENIPTREEFRESTRKRLKPKLSMECCGFNYFLDMKINSLKKSQPDFVPPKKKPVQLSREYIIEYK